MLLIDRTYLINLPELQFSKTVKNDVINEQIYIAQTLDLQRLLGVDFYNYILENTSNTNIQALLNGGNYDCNGVGKNNVGLKFVLAVYTKSRYSRFGTFVDNPFGITEKQTDYGNRISQQDRATLFQMYKDLGYKNWLNVVDFLNCKIDKYPKWGANTCKSNNSNQTKFTKIT